MGVKKIALATSIIGIFLIMVFSQNLEPKEIEISKINGKMIGQYVKVSGEVYNIKQSKITSFTIKDPSGDIYAFSYEKMNLTKGEYELIGKVDEYHGVLEIEVAKMKR